MSKYIAAIRCVCGRTVARVTDEQPRRCRCGTTLSLKIELDGSITPWASVPDHHRRSKYPRPEIETWSDL